MAVHPDKAGPFFFVLNDALRILYVDDDPILREFAVVNLSSETATVETAPDGATALAAIEAAAPDVLLLDLEMPTLDGFDVLRRLRANPARRHLPIIVVTGREDVEAVDQAFQAGATSFVVKPLNWRLLSHQIRYVCRAADAERRLAERGGLAARRLQSLAAEAARFIARALPMHPALKPAAAAFARAADAALGEAGGGDAEAA
ncbi:MAG TPA: response regulator [Caulobacteraceae bacterium]|nr:response regulator [Caulobacteraceae bacterium]